LIAALAFIGAVFALVLLMTRAGATWARTPWLTILLVTAAGFLVGWLLDSRSHFSILLKLGLHGSAANGGSTMFGGTILLFAAVIAGFVAFAASSQRSGTLVS
jgi:hypothetical protein